MRILSTIFFATALVLAAALVFAADSITIDHPWARATPGGAQTGAVYMKLVNVADTEDRLTGGNSAVANEVQIHEMAVENGVMNMRELPNGLAIPAKGSVSLKPGSYHVMLIGLKQPLKQGEHIALTLYFEKAGKIDVDVPVLSMAATHHGMDMK